MKTSQPQAGFSVYTMYCSEVQEPCLLAEYFNLRIKSTKVVYILKGFKIWPLQNCGDSRDSNLKVKGVMSYQLEAADEQLWANQIPCMAVFQ